MHSLRRSLACFPVLYIHNLLYPQMHALLREQRCWMNVGMHTLAYGSPFKSLPQTLLIRLECGVCCIQRQRDHGRKVNGARQSWIIPEEMKGKGNAEVTCQPQSVAYPPSAKLKAQIPHHLQYRDSPDTRTLPSLSQDHQ